MKQRRFARLVLSWMLVSLAPTVTAGPPAINFQPQNPAVILYQEAVFFVIASGSGLLSYQWRKDGAPIAGATNDQIILTHARFSDAGAYSVIVSNAESSATSADAVLTVNAPAGGDLDYSFVSAGSISGGVYSIAVQPDGKVLVAGEFSTVLGAVRSGIARLNADGTIDYSFMNGLSGPDNGVESAALQSDGKVLIAGGFNNVNGVSRNYIARLNADGSLDGSFLNGLSGPDSFLYSVAVQSDGKVLIAGYFKAVNGVSYNHIARLNADGSLDGDFQNGLSRPDDSVLSIAVQGDGKVLIGGGNGIARLNADGTLDSSFQTGLFGVNGSVRSVAVESDGKVLIGGHFSPGSGMSLTSFARLKPDGTLDSGFQHAFTGPGNGFSPQILSVAVQSDGKVLIGGQFGAIDGVSLNAMARFNADGSLDNGFRNGIVHGCGYFVPDVVAFAVQSDGKLLIGGGDLTWGDGVSRPAVARLNPDGTPDDAFPAGLSGANGPVASVAVQSDGKVLLGGGFIAVNGASRNHIARLNADGSLDAGFLNGLAGLSAPEFQDQRCGVVISLAAQVDGKVLVGGYFTTVNGVGRNNIARLNADGTLDSGFQNGLPGVNGVAFSVAVQGDGKVLVGGGFTTANGVGRTNIARLNTDGTLDSGFQNGLSGANGTVRSLAVQSDGKVLIGGDFTSVNGVGRTNIARLNADGSLDKGFLNGLSGTNGGVYSVAVQSDGKVLVGGSFTAVNAVGRTNIARLNADGTLDTGFLNGLSGANGLVRSLAVQSDGKVLIAGDFTTVNGESRNGLARLNADGTLDSGFQNGLSGLRGNFNPYISSVAVQSDGKVLIGGYFTTFNDMPAAYFARLWGNSDVPPQIQSVTRSGADVDLIWYALPNRSYRVQYSGNLSGNNWTDLAGDVSATGATASKTDATLSGADQRFYRVVLLP